MIRVTVREVRLHERDVRLRMPFRFGVVTLTECPQTFVRVRVEDDRGRTAWGTAAELLVPKWFDKNPDLSNEDNFDQLRASLAIAAELYPASGAPDTAFGHFAAACEAQFERAAARDLNRLIASYGPALVDRAVLDALCRLEQVSIFAAVRANLPGIRPDRLLPEFAGFDFDAWLRAREPRARIHARHTVGLVDPLGAADQAPGDRIGDGLPETLEEVVSRYRQRFFKLKVGGDIAADLERLGAIAAVLDGAGEPYRLSLDGNEQYDEVPEVLELWREMSIAPRLARLVASVLFIEQPLRRAGALDQDVARLDAERPVIIDESDDDLAAFSRARERGYSGISAKSCKGFYKALINACRCDRWNAEAGSGRYFMSAEDLTIQAGVALQQDLALASLLGVDHVERNGHHYVNGMADLSGSEQRAFLDAHPDLYEQSEGAVRLRIRDGEIALGSLDVPGFAVAAEPDWDAMRRLDGTA